MSRKPLEAAILTAMLALWLPAIDAAQAKPQASRTTGSEATSTKSSKIPTKLPLKDITFMSTSEAARKAAEATKAKPQGQTPSKSGQADGNGIMEFQTVKTGSSAISESDDIRQQHRKKPLLKDIHGSVYGSTTTQGAADRTAAGSVGAGSGNGKFNIFMETQHSQASNPGPE